MSPPTLLLVHGAFHGGWCWDRLVAELEPHGIPVATVDLPFTTAADDVAEVRKAIDRITGDVVVLGHSFGGSVISVAAAEDGHAYGGTKALVYLTALMAAPGQPIDFSGAPGIGEIHFGEKIASIDPRVAASVFYNRCSDEDAAWATAQLRTMPTSAFSAHESTSPAWLVVPSTYIVCTDDHILSTTAQEQMATNARATQWIDSDHSPFLSCPGALARLLDGIVRGQPPGT